MSEQQENTNQSFANAYQSYPYYYYPQTSQAYYPVYDYRQEYSPQSQAAPQFQQMPQSQQAQASQMQGIPFAQQGQQQGQLPTEQSYIENILRLNLGKTATIYMTFENDKEQVFKGILQAAGRDHIIISDPETGKRHLLLMVYLDYITFDEEINYTYPYTGAAGPMATYPSR